MSPDLRPRRSRPAPAGARRRLPLLLVLAAVLLVTACSGFMSKVSRRFGGKVSYDVEIDQRLNRDFPLAVDFGIVYDKELYAELKKLSASDWFAQREQYRLDNEPEKLEIHSREWVPACAGCTRPDTQVVDYRLGAHGGIVFANYFNPGIHRIVIEPLSAFTLKLGETQATLGPPPDRQQLKAQKKQERAEKRRAKKAKKAAKKAKKKGSGAGS